MSNFLKVGAFSPKVSIANPISCAKEIVKSVKDASKKNIEVLVLPELSLTGYTNQDNFFNSDLYDESFSSVKKILEETKNINTIFVFGSIISFKDALYNCAFFCLKGKIYGIVPKVYIPNYKEYYEKRHFASGSNIKSIELLDDLQDKLKINYSIPFSPNLLFKVRSKESVIGIEICEDLFAPIPKSASLSLSGANVILNLSASVETIKKDEYRCNLIKGASGSLIVGYVYANASLYESTTDNVFSGNNIIAENGNILSEMKPFKSGMIESDIDIDALNYDRKVITTFSDCKNKNIKELIGSEFMIDVPFVNSNNKLSRNISATPFIVSESELLERSNEILEMQVRGLITRLNSIRIKKVVIGLSGGLDSCLAFLAVNLTFRKYGLDPKDIITVSMPGFGTTDRTKNNAKSLAKIFNVTYKEIDIKNTVNSHFADIKKDKNVHDTTYENAQARVRTLTLFDIANKENALVIGTGDLSELALGFTTFGGDHLSNYSLNSGIPKTLVKHIIKFFIEIKASEFKNYSSIKKTLKDILNTPISPELLPAKNGKIAQKTEEIIGDYILHDFFLYHLLRYERKKSDILFLSKIAFSNNKDKSLNFSFEKINKTFNVFIDRFYKNQFKRSVMPDGLKVGSVSLSPRGDFRLPSDLSIKK